jgi:predicted transposase/invertase (TIGR01784 family)
MDEKPLLPRYDVVFKNIFAQEGNISILADFLKASLDLPEDEYKEIHVVDPHLLRRHRKDKLGIVDLRITTRSGKSISVELQFSPQPAILQRVLYYTANMLVDRMHSGKDYTYITRAICILISYSVLFPESKEFHNRFRLYDERTKVCYPEFLEINVLEVPKARGAEESRLANWLKFFAAETAEEFEMVSQTNPAIAQAWGVIQRLSGDAEARRLAEYEDMARWDDTGRYEGAFKNGEMKGRQEGLQEGLQEGQQKKALEVARTALREKLHMETVVKLTGLSLDEVKRLAADLHQ